MYLELFRRFGPFSRIGSVVNIVIVVWISATSILAADDDFEFWGKVIWAFIMIAIFLTIAAVVWVRSLRGVGRHGSDPVDNS